MQVQEFLDNDSETFSYVVFDKHGGQGVVIDPVLDFDYAAGKTTTYCADEILKFINSQSLTIDWVLETHVHADHLSGAAYLRKELNCKVAVSEHITSVQEHFKKAFNLDKEFLPNGENFDVLLRDGQRLEVGDLTIDVIHTPGHTAADLAYLVNETHAFIGDTLFMPDVGTARCDFPGGSASTLFDSIQKLLALHDETKLYVCHDYPPEGRKHTCSTTVLNQRTSNKHVGGLVKKEDFVATREQRDATLAMPRLIIPSLQVNIRAGDFPSAENNGVVYLKVPINLLGAQ
jgi:glyoxylase-like metal-dependent hydrolase (beta-lactamase superfamily II)